MREILFRGKRIDNGEWIEGSLINDGGGRCFIAIHPSLAFGPTSKDEINGETLWGFYPFFEVVPSTMGQYTGLTDKNGKKIFEGDIIQEKLEDAPELLYTVMFKEGSFLAKCISIDNDDVYLDDFLCFGEFEGIVIGNIHDIPELMEGKS